MNDCSISVLYQNFYCLGTFQRAIIIVIICVSVNGSVGWSSRVLRIRILPLFDLGLVINTARFIIQEATRVYKGEYASHSFNKRFIFAFKMKRLLLIFASVLMLSGIFEVTNAQQSQGPGGECVLKSIII